MRYRQNSKLTSRLLLRIICRLCGKSRLFCNFLLTIQIWIFYSGASPPPTRRNSFQSVRSRGEQNTQVTQGNDKKIKIQSKIINQINIIFSPCSRSSMSIFSETIKFICVQLFIIKRNKSTQRCSFYEPQYIGGLRNRATPVERNTTLRHGSNVSNEPSCIQYSLPHIFRLADW